MLDIILFLIKFCLLVYLSVVLTLRSRKTQSQYLALLASAIGFSILSLILKFIYSFWPDYEFLMDFNKGATIAANIILVVLLILILARKELIDRKILYSVISLGFIFFLIK